MKSFGDNTGIIGSAQFGASRMFAEISVMIVWANGRACGADDVIHVHLTDRIPANLPPDALALARLDPGTHIEIFNDRVMNGPSDLRRRVLIFVLMHEIAHILQGVNRHSETGIMKAHWTQADFNEVKRPLTFAAEDVALIHLGLKHRPDRIRTASMIPAAPNPR